MQAIAGGAIPRDYALLALGMLLVSGLCFVVLAVAARSITPELVYGHRSREEYLEKEQKTCVDNENWDYHKAQLVQGWENANIIKGWELVLVSILGLVSTGAFLAGILLFALDLAQFLPK
jgi:hypothetical protein